MVKTAFLTALLLGVSLVVSFALIGCEGCYQEERFHDQQTETAIAAKAQETPVPTVTPTPNHHTSTEKSASAL